MTGIWTHQFARPLAALAARLFQALTIERELEQWFAEQAPEGFPDFFGNLLGPEEESQAHS